MAFNQHGVGHYDAVRDGQASTEPCSCRCGINKKSKSSLSCVNVVGQYASRCKCLRAEHSCHDSCKCMNCGNPHGQHSNPPNPTIGNKRVRQQHELTSPLSVKKFIEERGEAIHSGPWTMLEYMLFESLIQYHSDENIPISADSLHTSYKQIINMLELSTNDLQLPLGHKTILQVSARLKRHYQVMAVFKTIFCHQVSLNLSSSS